MELKLEVGKTYQVRDPKLAMDLGYPAEIPIVGYDPKRYFKYQSKISWLSFTEDGFCRMSGEEFGLDLVKEVAQ